SLGTDRGGVRGALDDLQLPGEGVRCGRGAVHDEPEPGVAPGGIRGGRPSARAMTSAPEALGDLGEILRLLGPFALDGGAVDVAGPAAPGAARCRVRLRSLLPFVGRRCWRVVGRF